VRVIAAFTICTLSPLLWAAETVLERLDHFYALSAEPQALYRFFTETLQLPAAWEFENYGSFASGGISFGNVAFEVLGGTETTGPTAFSGIAFIPRQNAGSTRTAFAQLGVRLAESRPYVVSDDGEEVVLWENMTLPQLSSPGLTTFVCDYKFRPEMNASRDVARRELVKHDGGPLGLIGLEEIRIGASRIGQQRDSWAAVLQDTENREYLSLGGGERPRIVLVPDDKDRVLMVTLRVSSLEQAESWLRAKALVGAITEEAIDIEQSAVQGLRFRLIE